MTRAMGQAQAAADSRAVGEGVRAGGRQKGEVDDAERANQDGALGFVTAGQPAHLLQQGRQSGRESGDAENYRSGSGGEGFGREFAEASEELISLSFIQSDKFRGVRFL